MKTIVVLGDCQSNGNNCLAHQIIESPRLHTWSLRFHKEFQPVFKWYLKHKIAHNDRTPMPNNNLEGVVWHYFWEQELAVSWPFLLDANVINFSKNGAHFIGYHHRLKKYLKDNPAPDHIIITDYTFSHQATSFRFNNRRYLFERETYIASEWNANDYPEAVHLKRLAGVDKQKKESHNRKLRKHRLAFKMLIKFIESQNIPYTLVRFNSEFDEFMPREVDCTSLYNQYTTVDGEDSKLKFDIQPTVAELVATKLSIAIRSEP